jgi:hypothetical protein
MMTRPRQPRGPGTRPRDRSGSVVVQLTADERRDLLAIRDRLRAQSPERITIAGTLRWLIRHAQKS